MLKLRTRTQNAEFKNSGKSYGGEQEARMVKQNITDLLRGCCQLSKLRGHSLY